MGAPKTPLMVAPEGAADEMGQGIQSADLIRRVRKLNPRVFCPDIDDSNHIAAWQGVTSLWLGEPGGGGRPICGIRLGVIPEWTVIGSDGLMVTKGWRAIFERLVQFGVCTRTQLEQEFAVSLNVIEMKVALCSRCVREGKREATNGGKRGLCDLHDGVYEAVERARATGPEKEERANWTKEKIYVS